MTAEEHEPAGETRRKKLAKRQRIRLGKGGDDAVKALKELNPDGLRGVASKLVANHPETARLLLEFLGGDGPPRRALPLPEAPTPPGIAPAASVPDLSDPARGAALNQRRAQEEALRAAAAAKAGAPR